MNLKPTEQDKIKRENLKKMTVDQHLEEMLIDCLYQPEKELHYKLAQCKSLKNQNKLLDGQKSVLDKLNDSSSKLLIATIILLIATIILVVRAFI